MFKGKGKLSVLSLGFLEGVLVEDAVHLQEKFSHHGGKGDLGWFAGQAQSRIKFPQRRFLHSGQHHGAHVEGASHARSPAADMPLSFPWPALAHPRGQACQSRGLLSVEPAQLGHMAQHAQRRDRADGIELFELSHLLLKVRRAGQGLA